MKIIHLFLLLNLSMISFAQGVDTLHFSKLQVTNAELKDTVIFKSGDQVRIKTLSGKITRGKLDFYNSDTLIIQGKKIALVNIEKCCQTDTKRYKHGKHLLITGGILSLGGGSLALIGTTKSDEFLGGLGYFLYGAAAEIVSIPFFIAGAYYQNKNYKQDVYRGWKYEIIK
ncbi:MAG: hypothetical protein ABJG68_04505 [Crocinitomicaceae bacterium]